MGSSAKTAFDDNKKDVDQLWKIHEEVAGIGKGRKYGVDVINRAAIVFITACWESYVEDIVREGFAFMLANVPTATAIPMKVRDFATKDEIFTQKDSRKIWDLADGGWRSVLENHKAAVMKRWVDALNTPKSEQVNSIFEELLGIGKMSNSWTWQNMSAIDAARKLDEYITIRGNIAHRTAHDETVYKNWGTDFLNHVESLVSKTDQAVGIHLFGQTGKAPW